MLATSATPLFGDETPEIKWARDAVAALAAKGVVEGFPDGTFRGVRTASRWELAQIVASLLNRLEGEYSEHLTTAEFSQLKALTGSLGEELKALGVRVDVASQEFSLVEKRVEELERISFYGDLEVKIGSQSFTNDGSGGIGANQEFLNFHQAVGSFAGANGPLPTNTLLPGAWDLSTHGVVGVSDFEQGRPLSSGTLFTARATLGLKAIINEDFKAGLELKAYTSLGDSIVDAFYGVKAPYLSNQFAATPGAGDSGFQSLNNTPFTRMTLDNFWLRHEPSQTTARFGWFPGTDFSSSTFTSQRLPGAFHFTTAFVSGENSGSLGHYGVQLKGEVPLTDDLGLEWEGVYSRLPDGNIDPLGGNSYAAHAMGANLALLFHQKRGSVKLNYLHAANENTGGISREVGRIVEPVFVLQWVNPDGSYISQLSGNPNQVAGIGSFTDTRPVPGFSFTNADGSTGIPGAPNFGGVGPQSQNTYSIALDYTFDTAVKPHIFFEYARSDYQPSRNSSFSVDGQAIRGGFDLHFMDGTLNWHAEYVSTDPTFSPFLLQYPKIAGIPVSSPFFDDARGLYSLHDVSVFQNNRRGFRTSLEFYPTLNTQLGLWYGRLTQVDSSSPDIRFSPNSLGPNTPNSTVLGFTPGTREAFYSALSPLTFVPDGSGNAIGRALEEPKGKSTEFSLYGYHKWILENETQRGLSLFGIYFNYNFFRDSNLSRLRGGGLGVQGESENFQDLTADGFQIRVDYDLTKDFSAHAGFTQIEAFGHYDPSGVYSPFAEATGSSRFANIDITQTIPELGFDWKLNEKMSWGVTGRHIVTRDNIPAHTLVSVRDTSQNLLFAPTGGAHPFNWSGWQVHSTFSLSF